jgi:multidrug efflux pump subunit AcrA (membrane-fusion protein)
MIVVAWKVPVKNSITGLCRVEPALVWQLSNNGAGQIFTDWVKKRIAANSDQVLLQFERPDFVDINLKASLYDGAFVDKGDTIAVISSRERMGRLNVLQEELNTAQAEYEALLAGARLEDINVAEREAEGAKAAFDLKKIELGRAQALYDSGFVSLSDLQLVEGEYNILEAEFKRAQAQLNALKAGSRYEDIKIAEKRINVINKEIESIKNTLGFAETIISPISGICRLDSSGVYISRVENTDTLLVSIMIPENLALRFGEGDPVEIRFEADKEVVHKSTIFRVEFVNQEFPAVYALALVSNPDGRIKAGMTGKAKIGGHKITIFESLSQLF